MPDKNYLTLDDVLGIHLDSIEVFGGSSGLRDRNALEAAVMRPQSGYYTDVIAEAASLWESLSQNHPFVDGNKRTAIASMAAHLIINGYELRIGQFETYTFVMRLYETNNFRIPELEAWLRLHVVALG